MRWSSEDPRYDPDIYKGTQIIVWLPPDFVTTAEVEVKHSGGTVVLHRRRSGSVFNDDLDANIPWPSDWLWTHCPETP